MIKVLTKGKQKKEQGKWIFLLGKSRNVVKGFLGRNYSAKDLYYKKRRDAEAQRFFPFDREHPECAEIWLTSQPMTHIKNARREFYSPSLYQTLKKKSLRLCVSAFELKKESLNSYSQPRII